MMFKVEKDSKSSNKQNGNVERMERVAWKNCSAHFFSDSSYKHVVCLTVIGFWVPLNL